MFHYSPNSLPCFLPLLTDGHILIKAMHCKGKVLQGALFQQAHTGQPSAPIPSPPRAPSCFGRQAECCPHRRQKEHHCHHLMQAEWGSIQNRRVATCPQVSELSGSILCPILLLLFCLFAFLFFFTPFHLSYTDTLILPQFHPITLVEEKVQRMVRGLPLNWGDERD